MPQNPPVTWGLAMEVPDSVVSASSPLNHALSMPRPAGTQQQVGTSLEGSAFGVVQQCVVSCPPGAHTSRQLPVLLKEDARSLASVDPTVMAPGALAGEDLQASVPSLPAATTTGMFA